MKNWQTHVRDAAIRVIDEGAERFGDGERVVHKLAREWRKLSDDDKQEMAELVIAIGGVLGAAVATFREKGPKAKAKKLARKTGKKVLKKVAEKVIEEPAKKAKKVKKK